MTKFWSIIKGTYQSCSYFTFDQFIFLNLFLNKNVLRLHFLEGFLLIAGILYQDTDIAPPSIMDRTLSM